MKNEVVFEEGLVIESQDDGTRSVTLSVAIDSIAEKSVVLYLWIDALDSGAEISVYYGESADKKRWDEHGTALIDGADALGLHVMGTATVLKGAYVRFRISIEETTPTTTVRATVGLRAVFHSV